ncbi:hypothetical protein Tco_1395271, partial [Tanacetum coccineum]
KFQQFNCTIQLQPVVSTQGTHKTTRSAHRSPTLTTSSPQKKRKQVAGETSSPRKSLKVTIRQKKPCKTSLPPPGDDRERDEMAEDDDDDSGRIEPRSHKEHPEHVDDDDDETEKEKKDD